MSEIIRTRTNQEQNITLEMPYYDIVRIKARRLEMMLKEGGGDASLLLISSLCAAGMLS